MRTHFLFLFTLLIGFVKSQNVQTYKKSCDNLVEIKGVEYVILKWDTLKSKYLDGEKAVLLEVYTFDPKQDENPKRYVSDWIIKKKFGWYYIPRYQREEPWVVYEYLGINSKTPQPFLREPRYENGFRNKYLMENVFFFGGVWLVEGVSSRESQDSINFVDFNFSSLGVLGSFINVGPCSVCIRSLKYKNNFGIISFKANTRDCGYFVLDEKNSYNWNLEN